MPTSGVRTLIPTLSFPTMQLPRAGALSRPKLFAGPVLGQLRFASSSHHAHEEHLDSTQYNPEGLPIYFFLRTA